MRRRNRLSRSRDFDTVYRQGRSVSTRFLVLYAFPRPPDGDAGGESESRLGLAVSKKVGRAVDRTRLKRQLREAFDAVAAEVPRGHDYVLIVRPGFAEVAEARGFDWLRDCVREVFELTAPRQEASTSA